MSDVPGIRLVSGFPLGTWDIDATYWLTFTSWTGAAVFRIFGSTNVHAMQFMRDGSVRIGDVAARMSARLHIEGDVGTTGILVAEKSLVSASRTVLNLQNIARPEIVMGNTATGGEWSFGAGTSFILKQGAEGTDSATKAKPFEIGAAGDAVLAGSLTTGETSCGGGCDRVFAADCDLPSTWEHGAAMFTPGHLPNVGPTVENQPINLSDTLRRMPNELEHGHICITRLEAEVSGLRAGKAVLDARLAALEAD